MLHRTLKHVSKETSPLRMNSDKNAWGNFDQTRGMRLCVSTVFPKRGLVDSLPCYLLTSSIATNCLIHVFILRYSELFHHEMYELNNGIEQQYSNLYEIKLNAERRQCFRFLNLNCQSHISNNIYINLFNDTPKWH